MRMGRFSKAFAQNFCAESTPGGGLDSLLLLGTLAKFLTDPAIGGLEKRHGIPSGTQIISSHFSGTP